MFFLVTHPKFSKPVKIKSVSFARKSKNNFIIFPPEGRHLVDPSVSRMFSGLRFTVYIRTNLHTFTLVFLKRFLKCFGNKIHYFLTKIHYFLTKIFNFLKIFSNKKHYFFIKILQFFVTFGFSKISD